MVTSPAMLRCIYHQRVARRLVHVVLVALALAALAVGLQTTFGGPLLAYAGVVWIAWYVTSAIVMPRVAHAAFRSGNTARARRRYRVLSLVSPTARDAARVSVAGTHLIDRAWGRAQEALSAIDGARLAPLLRAAWLNNRAYAIARGGLGDPGDPLALV